VKRNDGLRAARQTSKKDDEHDEERHALNCCKPEQNRMSNLARGDGVLSTEVPESSESKYAGPQGTAAPRALFARFKEIFKRNSKTLGSTILSLVMMVKTSADRPSDRMPVRGRRLR